jgi:hypothetical protein
MDEPQIPRARKTLSRIVGVYPRYLRFGVGVT